MGANNSSVLSDKVVHYLCAVEAVLIVETWAGADLKDLMARGMSWAL